MFRRSVVVTIVVCASAVVAMPIPARAGQRVQYEPPVDAPVVDPFRPPPSPYAPGNRGLDYATAHGTPVRSAGDGEVVFAGSVAGTLHVTVVHADGLRTSYSFLAQVGVVRGQRVQRGEPVGVTGGRLHFGVRDPAGTYLDPALLFDGSSSVRSRLIPGTEEGAPALAARERAGFLQLVWERGLPFAGDPVDDARILMHYTTVLRPDVRVVEVVTTLARLTAQQRDCSAPGDRVPLPDGRRVALLVGGLGSTSESAAIDEVDTHALGYAPGDVVRFSYEGGRVPDQTDGDPYRAIAVNSYDAVSSSADLRVAAARLATLLGALSRAQPGVPIDVVAHSQGGVVARLAIATSAQRGDLPDEVATLATIGTPHEGADLATAAVAGGLGPGGAVALVGMLTPFDPEAPAVGQLAETSAFARQLRSLSLPGHLRRVSIAARGDLVVPLPRTMDRQMPSAVVPRSGSGAHDQLPGAPETTRELGLVLAGRPPTCAPATQLVADAVTGEAISWATDAIGAAALAA